jgi:hypothetical protein
LRNLKKSELNEKVVLRRKALADEDDQAFERIFIEIRSIQAITGGGLNIFIPKVLGIIGLSEH